MAPDFEDRRFTADLALTRMGESGARGFDLFMAAQTGECTDMGFEREDLTLTPRGTLLPRELDRVRALIQAGQRSKVPSMSAAEAVRAALFVLDHRHFEQASARFGPGAAQRAQEVLNEALLTYPALMDPSLVTHVFAAGEFGLAPIPHAIALNRNARFPRAGDAGVDGPLLTQWLEHRSVQRGLTSSPAPHEGLHRGCRSGAVANSVFFSDGVGKERVLTSLLELSKFAAAGGPVADGEALRPRGLRPSAPQLVISGALCSAAGVFGQPFDDFLAIWREVAANGDAAKMKEDFTSASFHFLLGDDPLSLAGTPGDRLRQLSRASERAGLYQSQGEFAETVCRGMRVSTMPTVTIEGALSFVEAARELGVDYTQENCRVRYGCIGQAHVFAEAARILDTADQMALRIDQASAGQGEDARVAPRRRRAAL